jgi:yecA family protein
MSGPVVEHERVERQLASADLEMSGAEIHGVMCGLLCAGHQDAGEVWLNELFAGRDDDDLLVNECRQLLSLLYGETREAIEGPGLGFSPLLPEDDKPLPVRAAAVRDWSEGFLYGIGLAGVALEEALSEHTQEALQAFSEITRLDLDALTDEEDDEEESEDALMQVSEFLWVAAMMVHDDLVPDETARS